MQAMSATVLLSHGWLWTPTSGVLDDRKVYRWLEVEVGVGVEVQGEKGQDRASRDCTGRDVSALCESLY